ncbi:MAG: glycosyltransferase family A protein [Synergistaceae bacterium]
MSEVNPLVTIITPTTGKDSLFNLIESITKQGVPVCHIILWDEIKDGRFRPSAGNANMKPEDLSRPEYWDQYNYMVINIDMKVKMVQGVAAGSALRSIGLMGAFTDLVTFADDDVIWEEDHLLQMMDAISDKNWAFCKRKIWTALPDGQYEYLGVDEFESVGEEAKTPYKMVDNNCMMFRRRFGVSAACLYREVSEYCDDRLFYAFLMKYAGNPAKTGRATINQVCPKRLEEFFRSNCTK